MEISVKVEGKWRSANEKSEDQAVFIMSTMVDSQSQSTESMISFFQSFV